MTNYFTKQEAINLLGQSVMFKETMYLEAEDLKFPMFEKGLLAEVNLIENQPEGITISLLIDEHLEQFDKLRFEQYCQLVQPEITAHACSV
jgi:hypothetical protein